MKTKLERKQILEKKFKKRIDRINSIWNNSPIIFKIGKEGSYCYKHQTKPCSCIMCKRERHKRRGKHKEDLLENQGVVIGTKYISYDEKKDFYLSLFSQYEKEISWLESEKTYFVKIKELPGCMSDGETIEKANENIKEAFELWIETMVDYNNDITLPSNYKKE